MRVRLVCLANSKKLGGRCLAGRVVTDAGIGPWVRPVAYRELGSGFVDSLPWEYAYDAAGNEITPLDVVDLGLADTAPPLCWPHQPENRLVDLATPLRRRGRLPAGPSGLAGMLSPNAALWQNGSQSHYGLHDRVPEADLPLGGDSLRFIQPQGVMLQVMEDANGWSCRALFSYLGVQYNLSVTDPRYTKERFGSGPVQVPLGAPFLTVSLGEPFHGFAYKLIAGIVEVPHG